MERGQVFLSVSSGEVILRYFTKGSLGNLSFCSGVMKVGVASVCGLKLTHGAV